MRTTSRGFEQTSAGGFGDVREFSALEKVMMPQLIAGVSERNACRSHCGHPRRRREGGLAILQRGRHSLLERVATGSVSMHIHPHHPTFWPAD